VTTTTQRSLAAALRDATVDLHEVERAVDGLLLGSFPGWRPRFPHKRGWLFTSPDVIDVYGVAAGSSGAIGALHQAGFRRVMAHDHRIGAACTCRPHVDDGRPRRP